MKINNITKIILDVSTSPNSTIDQICMRTEISKPVIKKIVEDLVNDSILIEKNNYYSLSTVLINNTLIEQTDIYFNLNIPKDIKEKIYTLFNLIEKSWIQITGKKPSKVQMQKTFVEINKAFNLNLPTGWYKYGEITPISYEYYTNYNYYNFNLITDIKDAIKIITNNTFLTPKQIKEKQYNSGETNFHKLYTLKEDFLKNICENKISDIQNRFDEFTKLSLYVESDIINQFHRFLIYYNRLEEYSKDYNIKNLFSKIFNKFWDIVSIYNYRTSLDGYYKSNNLDLTDLNVKLLLQININKQELNELLDEFYENFKVSDFYNDPDTKRLIDKVLASK
ncbi:MAG: hypothetical protein WCF78_04125 [archaeon]